ncbi:MAG TPA: hypothetical protein VNO23_07540 [Candidatus Binatia bacterium]|nr:hypothetical protein [Candidatus Binatia bacterium]
MATPQIDGAAHTRRRPHKAKVSPWGLSHRDEEREKVLTYIPTDEAYKRAARRARVKAALTCLLRDEAPDDLLDMLGIPEEECELARDVLDRVAPGKAGERGKRCPRCRHARLRRDYYRNDANLDGLAVWCKPCFAEIREAGVG